MTNNKNHTRITAMVFVALMAAFICIFAPISIPLTLVPISLQTFTVFVAAGLLGWKKGTLSVLIYLILGLIGLPVFAGWEGGFSSIASPSFGYVIGFVFSALLTGALIDRFSARIWVYPLAMIAGLAACYLFGTIWFLVYMNVFLQSPYTLGQALLVCVVPFLVGDALKIAAATALCFPLRKKLTKLGYLKPTGKTA